MSEEMSTKSPLTAILLGLLLVLGSMGGALIYLINTDNVPSWLSFIYGQSTYQESSNPSTVRHPVSSETIPLIKVESSERELISLEKNFVENVPQDTPTESPVITETPAEAIPAPLSSKEDSEMGQEDASSDLGAESDIIPDITNRTEILPDPSSEPPVAAPSDTGQNTQVSNPSEDTSTGSGSNIPLSPKGTKPKPDDGSVILYGKGRTVTPSANKAIGEIPLEQKPLPAAEYAITGRAAAPALSAKRQDSIVTPVAIDDFAKFLADNYWPVGSHPMAKTRGITTAGLQWANLRFGGQLQGFAVKGADVPQERKRILEYVYAPSMIDGLYRLYGDRFFYSLEHHAQTMTRGEAGFALDDKQMAEMYGIYQRMAYGLAGTIRTYRQTPDIRSLAARYLDASFKVTAAYQNYTSSPQSQRGTAGHSYQMAVRLREGYRTSLARALRGGGQSQGLDEDSMVYAALWLYRRGEGEDKSAAALEKIVRDCASRLHEYQRHYQEKSTGFDIR